METFFDDLNTDICIIGVMKKYPHLGIQGCAFSDNEIYRVNHEKLNNLSDFYSPEDGIFHVKRFEDFLIETDRLSLLRSTPRSRDTLGGFSMFEATRSVSDAATSVTSDATTNEEYKSELFIPRLK